MSLRLPFGLLAAFLLCGTARAQVAGGPPAVGVVRAQETAITETAEFVGRVQAIDRVALTPRVTGFLEQRLFSEGAEVKAGDLLFKLERPPYEAAVQQQEAAVAEASAKLVNANIQLQRAESLLHTPAGQRSNVDDATANQRAAAAQLLAAKAQLEVAQINLGYTEIHAPISGKISRSTVSVGNVVSPGSGALATIVSQDPMYVLFPIAIRSEEELEKRYAGQGGMNAVVVKLRLPDGSLYSQAGKIDYIEPSVQQDTDTIVLRARIANPPRRPAQPNQPVDRPLTDGEFVTVLVQGIQPVMALGVPRAAVLSDQQGEYVYVVNAHDQVEQRRIQLGQSTPTTAVVMSGLKPGEMVVVDGIQRVRAGIQVTPGPASPPPATPAKTNETAKAGQ